MKDIKKMPEIMPEYRIEKTDEAPFEVKWEEMMGWFIVPGLGEKLSWAMYDFPERTRTSSPAFSSSFGSSRCILEKTSLSINQQVTINNNIIN